MPCSIVSKNKQYERLLIRGDSLGRIAIWLITNDMVNCSNQNVKLPINYEPNLTQSLNDAWNSMNPTPAGIMDHLVFIISNCLTFSSYLINFTPLIIFLEHRWLFSD
jgi:WD repeat protein 7